MSESLIKVSRLELLLQPSIRPPCTHNRRGVLTMTVLPASLYCALRPSQEPFAHPFAWWYMLAD